MSSRARKPTESFEEYRRNLNDEERKAKAYFGGFVFWQSRIEGPYRRKEAEEVRLLRKRRKLQRNSNGSRTRRIHRGGETYRVAW